VAFLLPPFARSDGWRAPLHLAGERQRRLADLGERPAAVDSHVDVHAARTGRLGKAAQPVLLQHGAGEQRHLADLRPGNAGHRIQVDAQLVRMLQVVGAHRVRIQIDAAEVDHPGELRFVVHHHFRRRAEEELAFRAVDEALERHRAAAHPAQRAVRHGEVIRHQIALGDARARKEDLVWIGDRHLAAGGLQDLLA